MKNTVDYKNEYWYARTRLTGTVVMFKNTPVYVLDIQEDNGECTIRTVGRDDNAKVHLSELDLTPFPLGYVNTPKLAQYTTRKPQRYWKQGLAYDNLVSKVDIHSSAFVKMIKGIYPAPIKCYEYLFNGEAKSSAFSRYFSMKNSDMANGFQLLFKDMPVGKVLDVNGNINFKLNNEHTYLEEMLGEAVDA